MRIINEAGRTLIKQFEGCRLKVYRDPVGLPTVGVGHLLTQSERKNWPVGTQLSQRQIDILLDHDLLQAESAVSRFVTVPLSDNQYAALVSFTFNCGGGALQRSSVRRRLNAGNYHGAADALLMWNKAKGKVLPGLTRRRKAERDLFLS